MAITNYAIIDHVGSIDEADLSVYKKIYIKAKREGFEKNKSLFTMKKVCLADSPYARQVTDKMKYRVRYQKNPQKVYFICPTLDFRCECEVKKWHDRGIPVRVFEVLGNAEYDYKDFFDTHQIDVDGKASINRRIAEIWAPAVGYSFSAPIYRIQRDNNIENFTKRSDHDDLVKAGETHYSKPYTSAETFLTMNRCVATDEEIKEFRQYLDNLLLLTDCRIDTKVGASFGSVSGNTSALQEFLDIDYIICETCKRPMKKKFGVGHCTHCSSEIDERDWLVPYVEDASDFDE